MEKIYILLVEDQREVLHAVAKDLSLFEDVFIIEECESAKEASDLLEAIYKKGDYVALLISDHVMPEKSGIDFLIDVNSDTRYGGIRKILLTGLATHQDTIQAINQASIDKYLEKPWSSSELINSVKKLVTEFLLEKGLDYRPYLPYLDTDVLFQTLRKST